MLECPLPSAPKKLPNYCIYYDRTPTLPHWLCQPLRFLWAARRWVEELVQDEDFELIDSRTLVTTSGITVQCEELQEILDYQPTPIEAAYDFPFPYSGYLKDFRHPTKLYVSEPVPKERRRKLARARKTPGMITIGQLAAELSIEPKEARSALRKAKVVKPECGWAWTPPDAEKIRELLNKERA